MNERIEIAMFAAFAGMFVVLALWDYTARRRNWPSQLVWAALYIAATVYMLVKP